MEKIKPKINNLSKYNSSEENRSTNKKRKKYKFQNNNDGYQNKNWREESALRKQPYVVCNSYTTIINFEKSKNCPTFTQYTF